MCLRIKGIHRRYVGGKEGSEKKSEKERTGRGERKAAAHSNAHSDDYARRCQTCSQTDRQMRGRMRFSQIRPMHFLN